MFSLLFSFSLFMAIKYHRTSTTVCFHPQGDNQTRRFQQKSNRLQLEVEPAGGAKAQVGAACLVILKK